MKIPFVILPAAAALALAGTGARAAESFEYAEVVESRPVYRLVEVVRPVERCWIERVDAGGRSDTPLILGAVIGGAVGNAAGRGKSNKRVGAALGALLGHSIGRDIVRRGAGRAVERCGVVDEPGTEERLIGWQVTYLYDGEEHSVRMPRDPGDTVRLRISAQPMP